MINKANLEYKQKMSSDISGEKFEWIDEDIFKYLTFDIPLIHSFFEESDEEKDIINVVNSLIIDYNTLRINHIVFLSNLKLILNSLPKKYFDKYFYNKNYQYYKNIVNKQTRFILKGLGGIGKSRFIYDLEEKLSYNNINHLVIYGKHEIKFEKKLFKLIKKETKKGKFFLIIDAVNEIDDFKNYFKFIKKNINNRSLSIMLSYRDGKFDATSLLKIGFYEESFLGVEYSSAISEVLSKNKKDSQMIADFLSMSNIFYTNNPLHLKIISNYYSGKTKHKIKNLNAITTVTFFLEQYYKNVSNELWHFTKRIAEKMYENKRNYIYLSELEIIEKNKKKLHNIINTLVENGFIYSVGNDEKNICYYFGIQLMHEFLLVRYFFEEIENNYEDHDMIDKINEFIQTFPNTRNYVPLVLFDKIDDVNKVFDMLNESNQIYLDEYFLQNLFYYPLEYINIFQKNINISSYQALINFAGKTSKAFNCVYYLNDLYYEDQGLLMEDVTNIDYDRDSVLNAIYLNFKNILYRIVNSQIDTCDKEEFFSYAIWLLVSQNENIQILSMKTIIYIIDKDNFYISKIIDVYNRVSNIFLKNNIICLLTYLPKGNDTVEEFLIEIFNDYNYTNSKNLSRINKYLGKELDYLMNIPRLNKYILMNDCQIDESFKRIYLFLNIHYKDEFIIKDGYSEEFNSYKKFIDSDKDFIRELNASLLEKYFHKIEDTEDGCIIIDWDESKKCSDKYSKLDLKIIVKMISEEYYTICNEYGFTYDEDFRYNSNKNLLYKIMKLSEENVFGSVMCNYYMDDLIDYKCNENIGFRIYNPIEYELDRMNLYADIGVFNEDVYNMDKKIMKLLNKNNEVKDQTWADDLNCSLSIINDVIKPINYKGEVWIPISMYIDNNSNDKEHTWRETYSIYSSYNTKRTLCNNSNDRYLTIEHEDYKYSLKDYIKNLKSDDLSLNIKPLMQNIDLFKFSNILLPPSSIIKKLELTYSVKNSAWLKNNEKVIVFNGINKKYFEKGVKNSFYIKKKYYDELNKNGLIKLFGYTEKIYKENGYSDKSAIHYEIKDYKIIKQFLNYKNNINTEESNDNNTTVIDYKSYLAKFNIIDDIE